MNVISTPLGTSKTTTVCEVINERKLRAVIMTPTHALGMEIINRFGSEAHHIRGKDNLLRNGFACPHQKQIREAQSHGRGSYSQYCHPKMGSCKKRDACEYLRQFDEVGSKQVVVLTHDHLSLNETLWSRLTKDRDVLVVDENFLPKLRQEEVITRREIVCLSKAIRVQYGTKNLNLKWMYPIQKLFSDGSGSLLLPQDVMPAPRLIHKIDKQFQKDYPSVRNPLRILSKACQQESPMVYRKTCTGGYHQLTVVLTAFLPRNLPVFILDSTSKPEYYQWALGDEFEVKGINPAEGNELERNAHIIQCLSGSYPNSTLLHKSTEDDGTELIILTQSSRNLIEFIRNQIAGSNDFGVISTLKMEKQLLHMGFPRENLLHFNNLRGRNAFNNVKKLFIVGYQGISHTELARQARILFRQEWNDEEMAEELRMEKEYKPIQHWSRGLQCHVRALNPSNPYIRALHEMMIVGEVEQALGRARIYLPHGKDRTVFLLTNLPLSLEVDEIMMLNEPAVPPERNKLIEASRKLLLRQDSFARAELRREASVGKNTITDHIFHVCTELDLIEITGVHNKKMYRKRISEVPSLKEKVA